MSLQNHTTIQPAHPDCAARFGSLGCNICCTQVSHLFCRHPHGKPPNPVKSPLTAPNQCLKSLQHMLHENETIGSSLECSRRGWEARPTGGGLLVELLESANAQA